jgi:hypothetical protein
MSESNRNVRVGECFQCSENNEFIKFIDSKNGNERGFMKWSNDTDMVIGPNDKFEYWVDDLAETEILHIIKIL